MAGPADLQRFLDAQAPIIETAFVELAAGQKRTHWMWFVFPQLRGLGLSPTSHYYGLASLEEARAFLAHPVLSDRLAACTRAVIAVENRSLHAIFGSPDDSKFCSSMTIFALADHDLHGLYRQAIDQCCEGRMDARTMAMVRRS